MVTYWFMFAASDAWDRLGKQFQQREVSWQTWLGLTLPMVLVIVLVAFCKWWTKRGAKWFRNGPWPLFRELASAHGLTWNERRLLRRLVKTGQLAHPTHVFLNPAIYTNKRTASQLARVWPRILRIRDKLFL